MASQRLTIEDEVEVLAAEVQRSDEDLRRSKTEIQSLLEQNQLIRLQVRRLHIDQSPVSFPNQSQSGTPPTAGRREHESTETHATTMNDNLLVNPKGPESPMHGCLEDQTQVKVAHEQTAAAEAKELHAAQWSPSKTSTAVRRADGLRTGFLHRQDLDASDVLASIPHYQRHRSEVPGVRSPVTLSKPNVSPDKFDGRTPWRDYLSHFEACKVANNWGDDQAKVFLAASLRGSALKILGSKAADTSRIAYQDLVVLLEKRFGPGQLAENFLLELRYRRQGPRETLQELGQAIRELSMLAYPELTEEAQDRLARTHFAEAIEDQSIREGVFRSKPTTMDEAIQAALATDNFFRLEEQGSGRRQKQARAIDTDSAATINEIWRELKRIDERIAKQERPIKSEEFRRERPNSYRRRTPTATDECYECHEKGHFRRNCPHAREYRRPSGNEAQPTQRPEGRLDGH